ncbi:class I SAM-dependent methyltransferase [bacterium]|nr:class I SAM-dependent methyltransferase [bacterium]
MGIYAEWIYPWILDVTDPSKLDEQRGLLLKSVTGDVLEIGMGTGSSLPHYPDRIRKVTVIEPSTGMHRRALRRAAAAGRTLEIHQLEGERLPFHDRSFDSVVTLLVLCTVSDIDAVLGELYRVLRPGGRCFFLEHVVSSKPRIRWWQQRLNRLQRIATCGCELIRDTEKNLRNSSFEIESLEHATLPGVASLYPLIRGVAAKPG